MLSIFIQIIIFIYNSYIMFLNKKKHMLINMFVSSLLSISLFFVNGLSSAIFATITITIRNLLGIFKNKYKYPNLVFLFCLFMHIIVGAYSSNNIIELFPMFTSVIAVISIWYGNEQELRFGLMCSNIIWLIYCLVFGMYISSLQYITIIIIQMTSLIKNSNINFRFKYVG